MTTPSGIPRASLQWLGAARGAASNRASTADFYQALRDAGALIGKNQGGLTFGEVNQLRSAAASLRNAQERFQRAPDGDALDASHIGQAPYGRSLDKQAAMPIYNVGITLNTITNEGDDRSRYTTITFTGQLPPTKAELLLQVEQDARAYADQYEEEYAGHDIVEILAI